MGIEPGISGLVPWVDDKGFTRWLGSGVLGLDQATGRGGIGIVLESVLGLDGRVLMFAFKRAASRSAKSETRVATELRGTGTTGFGRTGTLQSKKSLLKFLLGSGLGRATLVMGSAGFFAGSESFLGLTAAAIARSGKELDV